jgi:hypothetical protein
MKLRGWSAEWKHDPGADGFGLKQFFATEAAVRAVPPLKTLSIQPRRDGRILRPLE